MNARDELADAIHGKPASLSRPSLINANAAYKLAGELVNDGWAKRRAITTTVELDALPVLSSVMCFDARGDGYPAQRGEAGWKLPFIDQLWTSQEILDGCESVMLLHEGQA